MHHTYPDARSYGSPPLKHSAYAVKVLMDILGVAISCRVSTFVLEQLATGLQLPAAALP